jgi:hypothetical protein
MSERKHKHHFLIGLVVVLVVIYGGSLLINNKSNSSNSHTSTASTGTKLPTKTPISTVSTKPTSTPAPAATPPPAPGCYTASQAASEEGQTGCVQFVGYSYTSDSGQMYLDQSTSAPYGFSAWIPVGSVFGPGVQNDYSGRLIDVTGRITNYEGEPEIEVTSASQIHLAQ